MTGTTRPQRATAFASLPVMVMAAQERVEDADLEVSGPRRPLGSSRRALVLNAT